MGIGASTQSPSKSADQKQGVVRSGSDPAKALSNSPSTNAPVVEQSAQSASQPQSPQPQSPPVVYLTRGGVWTPPPEIQVAVAAPASKGVAGSGVSLPKMLPAVEPPPPVADHPPIEITLVPYKPEWARDFERERQRLADAYASDAAPECRQEVQRKFADGFVHVGSTSIPGATAKPYIDIGTTDTPGMCIEFFERHGYRLYGRILKSDGENANRYNSVDRRYLFKPSQNEWNSSKGYFIHMSFDNYKRLYPQYPSLVKFAQLLRSDASLVEHYNEAKRRIVADHPRISFAEYTMLKTAFILRTMKECEGSTATSPLYELIHFVTSTAAGHVTSTQPLPFAPNEAFALQEFSFYGYGYDQVFTPLGLALILAIEPRLSALWDRYDPGDHNYMYGYQGNFGRFSVDTPPSDSERHQRLARFAPVIRRLLQHGCTVASFVSKTSWQSPILDAANAGGADFGGIAPADSQTLIVDRDGRRLNLSTSAICLPELRSFGPSAAILCNGLACIMRALDSLQLSHHLPAFIKENVTDDVVCALSTDDLRTLGLGMGDARRFSIAVQKEQAASQGKVTAAAAAGGGGVVSSISSTALPPDSKAKAAAISSSHLPSVPILSLPSLTQPCGSPGASGSVYKIEYQGKVAAAKEFHKNMHDMLRRELKSLQLLAHENIVRVMAIITDHASQPVGFIMEHMHTTLEDAMQHTTLRQAVHAMSEAAIGVAVAHDAQVIHSDIKPGNILCSADFSVIKLADFGLAHAVTSTLSSVSGARGTPLYMAPELHANAPPSVGTDVFSFGMTGWQVFHPLVKNPFAPQIGSGAACPAPNPMTIMFKLAQGERPAFTRADAPPALKQLVARCIAHDPSQRPSSMWDVHRELKSILQQLPDTAPPSSLAALLSQPALSPPLQMLTSGDVRLVDEPLTSDFAAFVQARARREHPDMITSRMCRVDVGGARMATYMDLLMREVNSRSRNTMLRPPNPCDPPFLAGLSKLKSLFESTSLGPSPPCNIVLAWHGTPAQHVEAVCRDGPRAFRTTDGGFFGAGSYFAAEMEYATSYAMLQAPSASGEYPVILFAVSVASAYVVTPGRDYPADDPSQNERYWGFSKFYSPDPSRSVALMPRYNAHFVPVRYCGHVHCVTGKPLPLDTLYQAAVEGVDATAHELVVASPEQALPVAVVWLRRA